MFEVLHVDGPNIVTDKGMVCLGGAQYADGGKTKPPSEADWVMMRALFMAAPELLEGCRRALRACYDQMDSQLRPKDELFIKEALSNFEQWNHPDRDPRKAGA